MTQLHDKATDLSISSGVHMTQSQNVVRKPAHVYVYW